MAKVITKYLISDMGFSVAQTVQNLPAVQETWVRSPGWEDPLEMKMSTHAGILAWRIPWTEEAGGLQSMVSHKVRYDWVTDTTSTISDTGDACLESEGAKNTGEIFETEVKLRLGTGFRYTYRRRASSFIVKIKAPRKTSKLRCWFSCTKRVKKTNKQTRRAGRQRQDSHMPST